MRTVKLYKFVATIVIMTFFAGTAFSQNPAYQITSTAGGFVAPSMTTTQRTALAGVPGNLVYDNILNTYYYWNNSAWIPVTNSLTGFTGILPIANGGTNSGTALSGSSIMISNGTAIVQGAAGTTTTVLHGNAGGAPTYSAVSLTTDVTGILPVANGGTGSNAQNFVDLTTAQTAAGAKTWSNLGTFNAGLTASGAAINLNASSNFATNIGTGTTTGTVTLGGASNNINLPKQTASAVLLTDASKNVSSLVGTSVGQVLRWNGSNWAAGFPINAATGGALNTLSYPSTYTISGTPSTVTITTTSATDKVLINAVWDLNSSLTNGFGGLEVSRGATVLQTVDQTMTAGDRDIPLTMIDVPGSIGSFTYTVNKWWSSTSTIGTYSLIVTAVVIPQ